jgi:hypothetical protein
MNNIEEKLMQDELYKEHFVAMHSPRYDASEEINPSILGRDSHLDYAINWLKEYIKFPLIEDDFSMTPNEYSSRKEWRDKLINKYGEDARKFLFENKLRVNTSLSGLSSALFTIDFFIGDEFPVLRKKAKEAIKISEDDSGDYTEKDIIGRIGFIRNVEDKAYEVLYELSKN